MMLWLKFIVNLLMLIVLVCRVRITGTWRFSLVEQTLLIQRAFQRARLGACANLDDIRAALTGEGYEGVPRQLAAFGLGKQLRGIMAAVRAEALGLPA
jgi:hypothetical protein